MHRRSEHFATRPSARSLRRSAVAAIALGVLALAGCTSEQPEPTPTTVEPSASATAEPSVTPTPTPTEPQFDADGTAEDNLPVFALVVGEVWESDDRQAGRAYIDALVAVGFDISDMEVTEDYSTVGNHAESIQFSVLWGEDCLVGQVGPATGDPVATILPALAGGTCLIGDTRDIDW
ncbi:hypothetical protein [Microbacterium sp. C7(2022)]|uniref:DUF6993 domain-containing protein n=1 Tax=Microbacterium sp. C7(2022) TaxID=2992759 RepID=UPI00237B9537|nr:hypothetical protein [Microbacterium sp. C7(2022)]MDE0546947.1 hypothetical protein [Microbacterium sp. C7(2022)]